MPVLTEVSDRLLENINILRFHGFYAVAVSKEILRFAVD
jgi:hypothetical protein